MHRHWFRWMGLGSLLGVGLTFALHVAAPAQVNDEVVDIVRNKQGKFVFAKPNVTIKEGQSVKWVSKEDGTHKLVPKDSKKDAVFKNTGDFTIPKQGTTPDSATQKFEKAQTDPINYMCFYHPTMQGTIAVTK